MPAMCVETVPSEFSVPWATRKFSKYALLMHEMWANTIDTCEAHFKDDALSHSRFSINTFGGVIKDN